MAKRVSRAAQPAQMVPPGDESGWYYIIVAGVKSGTKWQDLKDFVRSGTNVEIKRVGTYSSSWNQQSLGAWILVKGREDFERVSDWIDGRDYGGMNLMAFKSNATDPIPVKDLAIPEPSLAAPGHDLVATNTGYLGTSTRCNGNLINAATMPEHTWYSTGSYPTFAGASPSMSRYCLDGYPQPGYTQPTLWDPTYAMSPGMYDKTTGAMQHLAIDDQSYGADLSPLYSSRASCHATTWSSASDASSCAGSASTAAAAAGAGVVLTEQRKVVLANLPSKMLDDAGVRSVLASAVGAKAVSRVQKIEFSRSTGGSKRNKPHGHVFVVFATARTAWDVVAALNGFKVWGHTVRAHLAKEGVAVGGEEDTFLAAESSPTAAAGTGGTGAYEGDGAEAPGGSTRPCPPAAKSKGKQAHREKDRKEKSSASASYSFSSKSKDKDKGRDRDQPSSVIVANGSGGQFSQHRSKHRDDSKRHRS